MNPFGKDDLFNMNSLILRNLQVSYLIVDEMHNDHPELLRDLHWDEVVPKELPYSVFCERFRSRPDMGSMAHLRLSAFERMITPNHHALKKFYKYEERRVLLGSKNLLWKKDYGSKSSSTVVSNSVPSSSDLRPSTRHGQDVTPSPESLEQINLDTLRESDHGGDLVYMSSCTVNNPTSPDAREDIEKGAERVRFFTE